MGARQAKRRAVRHAAGADAAARAVSHPAPRPPARPPARHGLRPDGQRVVVVRDLCLGHLHRLGLRLRERISVSSPAVASGWCAARRIQH